MGIHSVLNTMNTPAVLAICLLCMGSLAAEKTKSNGRSPKLFFVSSKSTTSTVSTTTLCYSSFTGVTASCGRKKRAILDEDLGFSDQTNIEADSVHEDIVSGMDEATSSDRQGKFLLYWLTTTSTLTSFTGTTTLIVSCIPGNINECG